MRDPLQSRPVLSALLAIMFTVAWNLFVWKVSLQWIHDRRLTEVSGPGGHPIGVVSAVHNPLKFWTYVAALPAFGAFFLISTVRELVFAIRHRPGLERLGRQRDFRQRTLISTPEHRSFRLTPWNRRN